jgi:peroxiredoxin
MVYLEQMSASGQSIVDSVALDNEGGYRFVIKEVEPTPSLYNVIYSSDRIPLLVSRGEKIELSAMGSVLANYTVTGSHESELLREFNQEYIRGKMELESLLSKYARASESEKGEIAQSYNALYREVKRSQISFIVTNKSHIAAIYALYQRLSGEQYLVDATSDIIYFRTVADAVTESYPSSPLLVTLRNDVARMDAQNALMQSLEVRDYPDIEADNMFGEKVRLSSLDGYVVLVDFWSAEVGNSNALNADMKSLYEHYEGRGFRIYQVALDADKALWIKTVQEQRLPWISVCDFAGRNSQLLGLYNIKRLPANYLIDRDGRIVGKDLYGASLEKQLQQLL